MTEDRLSQEWHEKAKAYVRRLKDESGLTFSQLSQKTGVSEDTISGFFNKNTQNPRFFTMCEIVRVLGGSVDEMMELRPKAQKTEKKTDTNVEQLLQVKDEMLTGYKKTIEVLEDEVEHLKTQNRRVMRAFVIAICVLFALLTVDVALNDKGWIHYRMSKILGTVRRA